MLQVPGKRMFVQPHGEPRGSRRAGLGRAASSSDRRPGGYSRGHGPQALAGPGVGAGRGVSVAGRRVWPGTRDSRLEARPAGGTRGPPRQAQPPAGGLSPNADRAQTCRLRFLGPGVRVGEWGRRGRPGFLWKESAVGRASFPASAGARLPRGRAARSPSPGALPLCLSAAPLLPDEWLLAGNWTRSWGAAQVGVAGRGRRAAGRLRVPPSGAGAAGDVFTSRQGKELDASKVLFTAGLCLLPS